MKIEHGKGTTEYGPGVDIHLTGNEVAIAIMAFLVARGVNVAGPMTITVNGELCQKGKVYVDPSGHVVNGALDWSGKGPEFDGKSLNWITNEPGSIKAFWPRRAGVCYEEGPPKETDAYTREEFEEMGYVGIYVVGQKPFDYHERARLHGRAYWDSIPPKYRQKE